MITFAAKVVLEDDGGRNFVDQRLVLTGLLPKTAIEHRLMSQYRGETLIIVFDGQFRMGFAPAVDELLHACQVLAWLAVGLAGLADDDTLHLLTLDILLQPVEQLRRRNSRQPSCNDLQRVGDCYTGTLATVINRKDSRQTLLDVIEQPGVALRVEFRTTNLVAAVHSVNL